MFSAFRRLLNRLHSIDNQLTGIHSLLCAQAGRKAEAPSGGVFAKLLAPWRLMRMGERVDAAYMALAHTGLHAPLPQRTAATPDKLAALRGQYAGQRCFILGTGPSLAGQNISDLRHAHVFSVNKGHDLSALGLDHLFAYVIADPAAFAEYGSDIDLARITHPFLHAAIPVEEHRWREQACVYRVHAFPKLYDGFFQSDAAQGIYDAHTVVLHALQLAVHMGFSDICFLGVDLDFQPKRLHFYRSSKRERRDAAKRSQQHVAAMREGFRVAAEWCAQSGVHLSQVGSGIEGIASVTLQEALGRKG